jgi:acyl carrier protein
MVPSAIMILPALPLTPNGKVDRRALPARALTAPQGPVAAMAAAPESSLEKTIAAIWCDVLKVPSVGTTDNFFDLGGHSLLVVQVQRRMQEELGREIGITDMFRYTTIRALAAHLAGTGKDSAVEQGLDRANIRRAMLLRRQQSLVQTASI